MKNNESLSMASQLVATIVQQLSIRHQTLATAESCTGGLCSSLITDISGSSSVFLGGIISYSNRSKQQLLQVQASTIQRFGAVSSPVATEMAQGAQTLFASDYAIAITGIAGPSGGTLEQPVGTAFVGIAMPGPLVTTWRLQLTGDRCSLKAQFALHAFQYLWSVL